MKVNALLPRCLIYSDINRTEHRSRIGQTHVHYDLHGLSSLTFAKGEFCLDQDARLGPEMYEQEDLDKLFKACDAEEQLWYEFFLMTGMREQEVMYTYWSDVNLAHATVRVSHKPDRGWTPKTYKEREIPIPAKLVKSLKAWKAKANKSCNLVFPTAGCNPKLDFLDCLKTVAERAKLDEDNFWLHKFRATFATRCLWAGVDLRTVQQWLGHSDMESTMRYLKPSRSQYVRDKVNEIFA
jgi:integrase/recombinase XerD